MTKYRAIRTTVDGITFDSKRESLRYGELILLERGGVIRDLTLQPKFPIVVCGQKVCDYTADFAYYERGEYVVEDVKSQPTKTPVYRLKKKLMKAVHGIEIKEV